MLEDQDLLSIQEVRSKVETAHAAWLKYRHFSQAQIDAVVEAVAATGRAHARELARMAVEETGYGNVPDKIAKNLLNADLLPRAIRGMKTVGVLREIPEQKVTEIGVPLGVVAAVLPTTNPTSTAIFKTIIALKAGNAVVHSPHPRARRCTCYTAALLIEAATRAGAPPGLVQCIDTSTVEATNALMRHPKTAVILATGGGAMVKAAYSSGKPAFGVGPGNVPVLIDESADVAAAVAGVVAGKSFDYGTVCSSEQSVVAAAALRQPVLDAFKANRAYLMNDAERQAVERALFSGGTRVNPSCVGQSPQKIAQLAGFSVPENATILVAEIHGYGKAHPLSAEKLSPVLALLFVPDFGAAMEACQGILEFGGVGHTCVIFARDEARVREFGLRMPAFRVLVNTPAPQGSVGITTGVQPSMTLGCGAIAGNATSDNVGPQHLINIKRIAWAIRKPEEALEIPAEDAVPAAPAARPVDRAAIAAAVDKYLASRGLAAPAAPPSLNSVVAGVVDSFLAARTQPAAATAPTCACAAPAKPAPEPPPPPPPPPAAAPEPSPPPPAPPVQIVDFVCESDVRAAISQSRKIFIGPKTIVTPSARELAGPGEILVMAQR